MPKSESARPRALLQLALVLVVVAGPAVADDPPRIVVGAKKFTEGAVLAELMAQVLETYAGAHVERRFNLAGTQVCFEALRQGEIDLYAEYTGTGLRDILHETGTVPGAAAAFAYVSHTFLERFNLVWLAPFGFNNTYVLIMSRERAAARGIETISQLAAVSMRYGMSHEFLQRPDGMVGLRQVYGLREDSTVGMEHDLAYEALREGAIDVSDGYSTDAKLADPDLLALRDDRHFFPPYEAAPLVRRELLVAVPLAEEALTLLAGRIDEATMRELNHAVEHRGLSPAQAAAEFLQRLGLQSITVASETRAPSLIGLLWQRRSVTLALIGRHLLLTGIAVFGACALGIPLGIAISRTPRLAPLVLGAAGVLQTIPSIALLAFMLPFFGIGVVPAIAALFLYGLLPILRNTVAGLRGIDPLLIEVAIGLGMRRWQRLRRVELPLAAPVMLAGIRTATVISIGTATLAAFIGAGGLGDPIVTGLTIADTNLVLSGAIPAAGLAILADAALGAVERIATPRGLQLAQRPSQS